MPCSQIKCRIGNGGRSGWSGLWRKAGGGSSTGSLTYEAGDLEKREEIFWKTEHGGEEIEIEIEIETEIEIERVSAGNLNGN